MSPKNRAEMENFFEGISKFFVIELLNFFDFRYTLHY